jgi:hypothetical protein
MLKGTALRKFWENVTRIWLLPVFNKPEEFSSRVQWLVNKEEFFVCQTPMKEVMSELTPEEALLYENYGRMSQGYGYFLYLTNQKNSYQGFKGS